MALKLFVLFLFFHWSECRLKLSIVPFESSIDLEENSDFNLTCKVVSLTHHNDRYDLTWKFPTRSNANGITIYQRSDQLTITIHKLQKNDTGQYVCKLQDSGGRTWSKRISLSVKSKRCHDAFFDCGRGLCIPRRYVCDGYVDCPTGYDEAFRVCGSDACQGKILCEGRCISKELCCDSDTDFNCSMKYRMPCCSPSSSSSSLAVKSDVHPSRPPIGCDDAAAAAPDHNAEVVSFACVVMVVSAAIILLACRACTTTQRPQRFVPIPDTEIEQCVHNTDPLHNVVELTHSVDVEPSYFALFIPGVGLLTDPRSKPPPYTESGIGVPPPPYAPPSPAPDKES